MVLNIQIKIPTTLPTLMCVCVLLDQRLDTALLIVGRPLRSTIKHKTDQLMTVLSDQRKNVEWYTDIIRLTPSAKHMPH